MRPCPLASGQILFVFRLSYSFEKICIFLERFYTYVFKYQETMANQRMFKEKQALILALLCEGTPINAIVRMLHVGKHAVLRVIRETGEAFDDYMDRNFRGSAVHPNRDG